MVFRLLFKLIQLSVSININIILFINYILFFVNYYFII